MIRGKMAVMFDPSKLMPGGPQNMAEIIRAKKERERLEAGENASSTTDESSSSSKTIVISSPPSANAPHATSPTNADAAAETQHDAEHLRHFSKPKVAGRKNKKIPVVQQDPLQRRTMVAQELSKTEEMYSMLLDVFTDAFIKPIRSSPASFGATKEQAATLCDAIEAISAFAKRFAREPNLPTDPATVFASYFEEMSQLYTHYITQQLAPVFDVLHALRANQRLKSHIRTVQAQKQFDILDNYLMPVQRLQVYELLLRKYAQVVGNEDSRYLEVLSAADRLRATSGEMTDVCRQLEEGAKLLSLQMKLSQSGPSVALYHPTRRLIAQRTLGKAKAADAQVAASTAKLAMTLNSSSNADNDKKRERDMSRFNKTRGEHLRWVVLCNDMLLWATEPPEMRYKGHVKLTHSTVTRMTLPDDSPCLAVEHSREPVLVARAEGAADDDDEVLGMGTGTGAAATPMKAKGDARYETPAKAPASGNDCSSPLPPLEPNVPADLPALLSPAAVKARKGTDAWLLVFVDANERDRWYEEIMAAQHALTTVTKDSVLWQEMDVRGDAPRTRCAIM